MNFSERMKKLAETDKEALELIQLELQRQEDGLEMIPSENFVSMPGM